MLSVSAWNTRGDAEAGSEAVAGWVAANMTELSLIDVHYGETMFDTSLDVTTSDRVTS